MKFYQQNDQVGNKYPHIASQIDKKQNKTNQNIQSRSANPRKSVLLKNQQQPPKQQTWFTRCCPCLQLSYYKDYFTVTNKDVLSRIMTNLKFWQGGFFQPLQQNYDMYGPFWLYTTLVFITSAVNNVLMYLNSKNNAFQYNFKVIGVALTVFYLLGLGGSALLGVIFGCMGINSKTNMIMCLYGYSMANYAICVTLCMLNMEMLTWLFLLYAGGTKIYYITKNMYEKLQIPVAKKLMITIIIIVQASLQCLIIKFSFIVHSGQQSYVLSHTSVYPTHHNFYIQNRHFTV